MNRVPVFVEVHYALWVVLAVPLGFAGTFYVFPGLLIKEGALLLATAGFLLFYVSRLTRFHRSAWLMGLVVHAAFAFGAFFYIPRWPDLLAVPLALASLYSLLVLLLNRRLWLGASEAEVQPA